MPDSHSTVSVDDARGAGSVVVGACVGVCSPQNLLIDVGKGQEQTGIGRLSRCHWVTVVKILATTVCTLL